MASPNSYFTSPTVEGDKIKFFFESIGQNNLSKAIEYSRIYAELAIPVFNLGFGDFDETSSTIRDDATSNNGDPYKVFNTVLTSVPHFFEIVPNGYIFVTGSDSTEDFIVKCRGNCFTPDKCAVACRNCDKRIRIYRRYIDKHFEEFSKEYTFLGSYGNDSGFVTYEVGKPYKAVMVCKKFFGH